MMTSNSASTGVRQLNIALALGDRSADNSLLTALQAGPHVLRVFSNGVALRHSLSSKSFDIIVLDWGLPDMPGIVLSDWIRRSAQIQTPVLFVGEVGDGNIVAAALRSGADDFVSSDIRGSEFFARLEALDRRARGCVVAH